MNKKIMLLVLLLGSSIVFGGCNLFAPKNTDDKNKPEPTPFEREYDFDQKSDDGDYKLDLEKSVVNFEVRGNDKKINKGIIGVKSGSAIVEDGIFQSSTTVVDLASLKLEVPNSNLENAIKSDNYLATASNSEMVINIVSAEKISESPNDELNYEIEYEIGFRGKEKKYSSDASIVEVSDNVIKVVAELDIKLADFGGTTANELVENKFELNTDLTFSK